MSTLITGLFVINYILALIFILSIARDNDWEKVVEDMEEPLMEKETTNKFIRHAVSIMFLIPGFALYSFLKMIITNK